MAASKTATPTLRIEPEIERAMTIARDSGIAGERPTPDLFGDGTA